MTEKNNQIRNISIEKEKPEPRKVLLKGISQTLQDFDHLPKQKRQHLLLVEENETLRNMIQRLLIYKNFDIEIAASGQEALEQCKKNTPTIIVTNQNLTDMSGSELADKIKQKNELATIPVIALSEEKKPSDSVKGHFSAYISLPFNPHNFVDTIREFLP